MRRSSGSDAERGKLLCELVKTALKHIPFGWNQPNGMCRVGSTSPVRAIPIEWNREAVPFNRNPL
jgi:hypothetical protein